MSDLHGDLPAVDTFEECEVAFICGDISPLNIQANDIEMRKWVVDVFKPWCESLPCHKVYFIPGNHDFLPYRDPGFMYHTFPSDCKAEFLCDDYVEYDSKEGKVYSIYGTPWCKQFLNWPFMGSDEVIAEDFARIPYELDILLTHDQPYGHGDIILQETPWNTGESIGNKPLLEAVLEKQPKYMFCGHLHSTTHDCVEIGDTKRYNASLKDEEYKMIYKPLYLEI